MVECAFLKPCWWGVGGMWFVMSGRIIFSRIFAIGESNEMGRKEGPNCGFLFGFGIGMIFAVFQIWGMVLVLIDRLYILVR